MFNRCNVILAVSALLAPFSVGYADTIDFSTLTYVGTAAPYYDVGSGLHGARLTDTSDRVADRPAGAIWTPRPVSVGSGFTISFDFRMSEGGGVADPDGGILGADGFAFVIQNDPRYYVDSGDPYGGTSVVGIGAGGLGYMWIMNSLAVEFDTWRNEYEPSRGHDLYQDPDGNHVSVHSMGEGLNVPHHNCEGLTFDTGEPCTENPALETKPVVRPLNDGLIQSAKIVYAHDDLSVYLNSVFLFETHVDLDSLLALEDDRYAYVGFTAGTRGGYQNHDILAATVPEPCTFTLLSLGIVPLALALRRRRTN